MLDSFLFISKAVPPIAISQLIAITLAQMIKRTMCLYEKYAYTLKNTLK